MAENRRRKEDSWLGIYWKAAAGVIYLTICVFDFMVVPIYMGIWADHLNTIIMAIKDLPPDSQVVVLNLKLAAWEPLTLKGGGLFHVAFGAILGVNAWSGNQVRVQEIRAGWGPPDQQGYGSPQDTGNPEANDGSLAPPTPQPVPPVNINVQTQPTPATGAQVDNPDSN